MMIWVVKGESPPVTAWCYKGLRVLVPEQPFMTESVPVFEKVVRLRQFHAQHAKDRSTPQREIYWAAAQQVWIAVEADPRSRQFVLMSYYKTCPCGGDDAG